MSRLGDWGTGGVKHVLDKDTLTIVVNCLVFSKLFYCSHITPVLRVMQRQQLYYRSAVMAFDCVTGCAADSLTGNSHKLVT